MRRIEDIIESYDQSDQTDRKKIRIIEWLQKNPGERFDITEVYQELGGELDIGRTRTGQILKELEEDDEVLDSHGDQRKAYKLSEDIIIPIRYQAFAGLRHLYSIIDVERWGIIGVFAIVTLLWVFLTLPSWFLTLLLWVSPADHIGPITQYELTIFTISLTVWLLILTILTSGLQKIRLWWMDESDELV